MVVLGDGPITKGLRRTIRSKGLGGRVHLLPAVPQADLLPTALAIAEKIAANPPQAVKALKAGLRRTLDPDWRDTGKWAITEIRKLMQTEDAKESAAAFIEKRDPVFTGR